jgi:hypothetical protein
MTASECPSASELASILDRKANRRERRLWLSHLDDCLDCRTVLGEAASYIEESSSREAASTSRRSIFQSLWSLPLVAAPAALVVALFIGGYIALTGWLDGPAIEHISSLAATELLFSFPQRSYAEHRFSSHEQGLGFSSGLGDRERAFRVGVYLVDLRVAAHEGRLREALRVADSLEPLVLSAEPLSRFRDACASAEAPAGLTPALDAIEAEVRATLDPKYLSLGVWTESARLAAAANEPEYFSRPGFTEGLTAFLELRLPRPVASSLGAIQELSSRRHDDRDLHELERRLRELILLN